MSVGIKNALFTILAVIGVGFLAGCTPSGPKALLQGEELLNKGQTREAVKKMERAVKYMPNNPLAWNYLGVALHTAGRQDEALHAYQKASAINPHMDTLYYNLGCLYLDRKNYQIAIHSFSNYLNLEKNMNFEPAWEKIGYAFLAVQRSDLAAHSFSNVVILNPQNAKAYNTLGLIAATEKNTLLAMKHFSNSILADAAYAPPHLNTAILLQRTGGNTNLALALNRYERYLALAPRASDTQRVENQVSALHKLLSAETENRTVPEPAATSQKPTAVASLDQKPEPDTQLPATNQLAQTENDAPETKLSTEKNGVIVTKLQQTSLPTQQPAIRETTAEPEPVVAATVPSTTGTSEPPEEIDLAALRKESPEPLIKDLTPPEPAPRSSEPALQPENILPRNEEPKLSLEPSLTAEPEPEPAPVLQPPAERVRVVKVTSTPTASDTRASAQAAPADTDPERGNFFSRVFGKRRSADPSESEHPAPVAASSEPPAISVTPVDVPAEPQVVNIPPRERTAPAPVAPVPTLRVYEPYTYQNPPAAASGNREEAYPLFQRAFRAHQEKDFPTAIEYYSKAIQKDPAWFEAHFNLGLACYGAGEYSSSLLAFENALALKPDSWETRYNFALALNKAEHPNEAIVELKKVTRLNDSYANAWLEMGVIYQNRFADIENAYRSYQKFVALAPNHPSAYTTKIWLAQNASKVKAQP